MYQTHVAAHQHRLHLTPPKVQAVVTLALCQAAVMTRKVHPLHGAMLPVSNVTALAVAKAVQALRLVQVRKAVLALRLVQVRKAVLVIRLALARKVVLAIRLVQARRAVLALRLVQARRVVQAIRLALARRAAKAVLAKKAAIAAIDNGWAYTATEGRGVSLPSIH
ncbi:MAG: hypothetical protein BWK73_07545 [Thiothrix lacustris]|uniref:Uncharacterized protein n=1 Tax=Thiothrix lacustris TaxID=525917 RepID=A0A1Y1QVX2_9GAMM|nr:MAG: hypothetical protein BWK73_07545 [Thiothrix lacustris]